MEDCSIDAKRISGANVSLEEDFLMDSSFSCSLLAHLSPSPSPGNSNHQDESPKSAEQNVQKYNLRKSLAWDSEFFNSPGVLEPDELTSMIKSAENSENSALPKIQEDRQKSTNSNSTLVSGSFTIASLQDGRFEDKRASIQTQRSGKASRVENSSGKAQPAASDSHTNQSPKKKELSSHDKLKPKPSSMKLSVGTTKSRKAANPLTIHPRVLQLRNNYSGGQSSSSPSKMTKSEMHSPVVLSTKRDSKVENKNAEGATGRRVSSSKIHPSGVSHSMILPGSSSSRSGSSSTAAKKAMNSSIGSFISASSSSSSTIKSAAVISEPKRLTYASVLKKPPPASSIGDWSSKSTSSIPTTMQRSKSTRASTSIISPNAPHRPSVTSKQSNDGKMLYGQKTRLASPSTPNGRSASMGRGTNSVKPSSGLQFHPHMHRSSSAKISSTISPATSSTDWSFRSSSSVSTTKPRSNSATPRMGNNYPKAAAPGPLKSPKPSNDQQLDGQKTKMSARLALHGRSASTGKLVVKPSALRMPSPKIGFFDEVNSGRTPKGSKQSSNLVPGVLPKFGAKTVDTSESINKLKVGSIQSPRSTMTTGTKKVENKKQSRSHQEPSSSAERVSNTSSQPKIQDSKSAKCNANKEDENTIRSRNKEGPSELQTVKNTSNGVKIGGEELSAKLDLAPNELVKTVDSSAHPQVSKISSFEAMVLSSSTLSTKSNQSTSGGRRPFAAIHCNKDESSDGSTGLTQVDNRITIMYSSHEDVLDHVESSR